MIDLHTVSQQALRVAWSTVQPKTPRTWWGALSAYIDERTSAEPPWHRATAAREILEAWANRYGRAAHADMTHEDIRQHAENLARLAQAMKFSSSRPDPYPEWLRLVAWIERHQGKPLDLRGDDDVRNQLASLIARANCPRWWRRQIRRYVARTAEAAALELGIVSSRSRQLYCTDRAVERRQHQQATAEKMLKARSLENGNGQAYSLWDLMQRTTSNKAIRRGELMTRIQGAEEMAQELKLEGLFWTLTAPSRFHPRDFRTGLANPRYQPGLTPRDAQCWLREAWATARTRLKDRGITLMGLRVAEPHHDGCPHWHALLWSRAEHTEIARDVIASVWLEDSPDEAGARKHRTKWLRMAAGNAAGYVAKYVAKNIDAPLLDALGRPSVLGHIEADEAPTMDRSADLYDGTEITSAARVEAWSTTWGIRQFQAVGMPPVTVWRELRRIHERAIAGHGDHLVTAAWLAAHRRKDHPASWADYCRAQGGVMLKRRDYRMRLHVWSTVRDTGYDKGRTHRQLIGVTSDAMRGSYAPSARQPWGEAGFGAACRAAWTRLNNCGPNGKRIHYANGDPPRFGRAKWDPKPPPDSRRRRDPKTHSQILHELERRLKPGPSAADLLALMDARAASLEDPSPLRGMSST